MAVDRAALAAALIEQRRRKEAQERLAALSGADRMTLTRARLANVGRGGPTNLLTGAPNTGAHGRSLLESSRIANQVLDDDPWYKLLLPQIGEALVNIGPGLLHTGEQVGRDIVDFATAIGSRIPGLEGQYRGQTGSFVPQRTVELGKGIGQSVVYDFSHPAERPGYLALDLLGILSGGASVASRTAAAVRAPGARVAEFMAPPGPLLNDPAVVPRGGRFGYELTRRGSPGMAPISVERLLSSSPLGSTAQVVANRARQGMLDRPERLADMSGPGRLLSQVLAPEATFQRELRAGRRVVEPTMMHPAVEAASAAGRYGEEPSETLVGMRPERGPLTVGEHQLARVVGAFGQEAREGTGPLDTMVRVHTRQMEQFYREADDFDSRAEELEVAAERMRAEQSDDFAMADTGDEGFGRADEADRMEAEAAKMRAIAEDRRSRGESHKREVALLGQAREPTQQVMEGTLRERTARALTATEQMARERTQQLQQTQVGERRGPEGTEPVMALTPESARWRERAEAAEYRALDRRFRQEDDLGQLEGLMEQANRQEALVGDLARRVEAGDSTANAQYAREHGKLQQLNALVARGQERLDPARRERELAQALEQKGGLEGLQEFELAVRRPGSKSEVYRTRLEPGMEFPTSRGRLEAARVAEEGAPSVTPKMAEKERAEAARLLQIRRLVELRDERGKPTGETKEVGELSVAQRRAAKAAEMLERERARERPLTTAEARAELAALERTYGKQAREEGAAFVDPEEFRNAGPALPEGRNYGPASIEKAERALARIDAVIDARRRRGMSPTTIQLRKRQMAVERVQFVRANSREAREPIYRQRRQERQRQERGARWEGLRQWAEDAIATARARGEEPHPTAVRTLEAMRRREELIRGLDEATAIQRGKPALEGFAREVEEATGGDVGGQPGRPPSSRERAELLGTASATRPKEEGRLEERTRETSRRVEKLQEEIERLLGKEEPLQTRLDAVAEIKRIENLPEVPGAFRTVLFEKRPAEKFDQPYAPRAGPAGKGLPAKDATLTHDYRAGAIRQGGTTANVIGATANDFIGGVKMVLGYNDHQIAGRDRSRIRRSEFDMPWRETASVHKELRKRLQGKGEHIQFSLDEIRELASGERDAYVEIFSPTQIRNEKGEVVREIVDQDGQVLYRPGSEASDLTKYGVWWVDRRMFGAMLEPAGTKGWVRTFADAINNPFKALMIYGRLAYVLNLPGNFFMQAVTQGWGAPEMFARAGRVRHHYGDELAERIFALTGEGKARSFRASTATGAAKWTGAKFTNKLGDFWAKWVDQYSRTSAFLHEMRMAGIDLDDAGAVRDLLTNPARSKELTAISRRANKNMVEFNNLTHIERNTLRHLFFVYPWMSRATLWALRTMVEHPAKVWTLQELGQLAEMRVELELSELPADMRRRGYMVYRDEKGRPVLVGTAAINTFQTIREFAEGLSDIVRGGDLSYEDFATPLSELLVSAAGEALGGGGKGIVPSAVEMAKSLPQVAVLQRLGLDALNDTQEQIEARPLERRPVLQQRGLAEALGPFAASAMYPRVAERDVLRARVREEELAKLDKPGRELRRLQEHRGAWVQGATRAGLAENGKITDPMLVAALDSRQKRHLAYAQYAEDHGVPQAAVGVRFEIDLLQAVERGKLSDQNAEYVRGLVGQGLWTVRQAREWIKAVLGESVLSVYRQLFSYYGTEVP